MHTITVRVRRGGGRDRFGDPQPNVEHTIDGCIKWPRTNSRGGQTLGEAVDFSDTVTVGYSLHLPIGADLVATDDVLLPGEDEDGPWWSVEGEPLPWGPSPFTGWEPGSVASLTRSRG